MRVCVHVCVYVSVCVCTCVCMYMCMCVCVKQKKEGKRGERVEQGPRDSDLSVKCVWHPAFWLEF